MRPPITSLDTREEAAQGGRMRGALLMALRTERFMIQVILRVAFWWIVMNMIHIDIKKNAEINMNRKTQDQTNIVRTRKQTDEKKDRGKRRIHIYNQYLKVKRTEETFIFTNNI